MDPVFPSENQEKIAKIISQVLREEYVEVGGAVKRIARKIGANPRTVKNWYEGRRAPSLCNFISMAKTSSKLVKLFLQLSGYTDLADILCAQIKVEKMGGAAVEFEVYRINFDTIKMQNDLDIFQNLNQRQVRFYFQVRQSNKPTALDMTNFWNIGIATAKRDIAGLINSGLICFKGSRRNGYYIVCDFQ